MIDWVLVASNGLWILGFAVVLASLSYRVSEGRSAPTALTSGWWRVALRFGMSAVCWGWALSQSAPPWEVALWSCAAVVFLIEAIGQVRRRSSDR